MAPRSSSVVRYLAFAMVSSVACSDSRDEPGLGEGGDLEGTGSPTTGAEDDGPSRPGPGGASGVTEEEAQGCGEIGSIDVDDRICFYDAENPEVVVASIQHVLGTQLDRDVLYLRLSLDRAFVDNTYGAEAIGWDGADRKKGGHTFKDLVGSDHGRLKLKDAAGDVLLDFQLDYLSADESAPSGYASLGVWGGDGKVLEGPADAIVAAMSSLDRNLNERGYSEYTVDSPPTDASYSPPAAAPDWDFDVVYEAWIAVEAFAGSGLHHACIDEIHASPAKGNSNTKSVIPGPCCIEGDCSSGSGGDDTGGPSGGATTGDDGDGDGDGGGGSATAGGETGGETCRFDPDLGCDQGQVPPIP